MIQVGFPLLLCIAVVTAVAPAPPAPANPSCVSTCKAVTNLNLTELAGTWYEVRRIAPSPGREGICETATYKANEDKTLNMDIGWLNSAGKTKKVSGTIIHSGAKTTDGQVTFKFGDTSEIYTIFYVNYNTVFGVYACIANKAYVWVLSRTQKVADGALVDLNKAMTASGLEPKSLKPLYRTGCLPT